MGQELVKIANTLEIVTMDHRNKLQCFHKFLFECAQFTTTLLLTNYYNINAVKFGLNCLSQTDLIQRHKAISLKSNNHAIQLNDTFDKNIPLNDRYQQSNQIGGCLLIIY